MSYEIKGTIKHIGPVTTRHYNGKSYNSQKMLLEVPAYGDRVNTIPIEIGTKLMDHMDQYATGMEVNVHFDFRGNAYNNKTTGEPDAFLSVQTWKIDKVAGATVYQNPGTSTQEFKPEEKDNLPF